MKITKVETSMERKILAQMITDTPFLRSMKGIALPEYFESDYAATCAKWVWEFFNNTEEAPNKAISDVFLRKRNKLEDDTAELIETFLSKLSEDWDSSRINNHQYSVETAVDFFKTRSVDKLITDLKTKLDRGNVVDAEKIISEYKRVEQGAGKGVSLFQDADTLREAFNQDNQILFSMPGRLEPLLGKVRRGDFLAVLAPPKRGKTWWMGFFGQRAALQGFKVLFITIEMTKDELAARMWQSFRGEPLEASVINKPYFKRANADDGMWVIEQHDVEKKGLQLDKIEEHQRRYRKQLVDGDFRILEMNAPTTKDIEDELETLEFYENYVPDVIIIDYADIMKLPGGMDYRHKLDHVWKELRQLAKKRKCAIITGSQTNRQAMKEDADQTSVGEDMRKVAHVTHMIALNQTDDEQSRGIMRVSALAIRGDKKYNSQAVVLQSLDIGRPYLDSRFRDEVLGMEEEGEKKA